MNSNTRVTRIFAALAAVALLGACSSSPDPVAATTASAPSPSVSASSESSPSSSTAATVTADEYCPPGGTNFLDPTATPDALKTALASMARADDPSVAGAAAPILNTINTQSPPAKYALEAIARLDWSGQNAEASVTALSDALDTACSGISSDYSPGKAALDWNSSLGPRKGEVGVIPGGEAYGLCDQDAELIGFTMPFVQLSTCADGRLIAIDLDTGAVLTDENVIPEGAANLSVFGKGIVSYSLVTVKEASGLTDASWRQTIHLITPTGAKVADYAAGSGAGDGGYATPAGAEAATDAVGAVFPTTIKNKSVTFGVDTTGKKTWTAGELLGSGEGAATFSTAGGSGAVINTRTGKVYARSGSGAGSILNTNACLSGSMWANQSFDPVYVALTEPVPGKLSVIRTNPPQALRNYQSAVTSRGIVVEWDGNSQLHGWSARSRKKVWDLKADVSPQWSADSGGTIGDYGLVTNKADEPVLVNLNTGAEATNLPEDLAATLKAVGGRYRPLVVSPGTNDLAIIGDSGEAVHLPWNSVCAPAPA